MSIYDKLRAGIDSYSAEQTQAVAAEVAAQLPAEAFLALHGNLGVGKTTFVQGLAKALGIAHPITSPTFTVFNLYKAATGRTLVHMDAYRISGNQQMDTLMVEDFLTPPFCLVVEWPDNTGDWLPATTVHLELSIVDAGHHHLRLREQPKA